MNRISAKEARTIPNSDIEIAFAKIIGSAAYGFHSAVLHFEDISLSDAEDIFLDLGYSVYVDEGCQELIVSWKEKAK